MHNLNISDTQNNTAWDQIQYELLNENFQYYGMIVYRDQDKFLLEALQDEQTWADLHEISGERVLVFAFQDRAYKRVNSRVNSNQQIGCMSALPPRLHSGSYASTSTSIEYSKLLKGFTGKNIKIDRPFLFLFCNRTKEFIALELSTFTNKDNYSHYLKETFKLIDSSLENHDLQFLETNWSQGGGRSILNGTIMKEISSKPAKLIEILKMFVS